MTAHHFNHILHQPDLLTYLQEQATDLQDNIRTFQRNEYLLQPHHHIHHIYIVMEGRVKVGTYGTDSKEMIKKIVGPGGFIGDFTLSGTTKSNDYAISMESTKVYALTKPEIAILLQKRPGFFFSFMDKLGEQLLEMEQRLEHLVFKDSRSRIIHFLEKLVKKNGQRIGYEMLVRPFFTHQDIASQTATSRQTVTTVLNELRNKHVLTFNRRRLLVRDMDLLRAEL